MSVVSKDVVFHVKFDLEEAKKQLDKDKDKSGAPKEERGAPHKEEAKIKRGASPSKELITQNILSKHYAKQSVSSALKENAVRNMHTASPTGSKGDYWFKLISGPGGNKYASDRAQYDPNYFSGGGKPAGVNPKAAFAAAGFSPRSATKSGLKHGLGVGEAAEMGFMARMAGIPFLKSTLSSALGLAKIASPAVIAYELAKHAPLLSAARSEVYGGKGTLLGDLLDPTTMISQGLGQVQRSYQLVKSIAFRPVAYHGYEAAMGKQGGKRGGGALQINGTNLGSIEYDINDSMDRLDYARDRGMMMRVGRAYGGKFMEKMGFQPGENPIRKLQEEAGLTFKKS